MFISKPPDPDCNEKIGDANVALESAIRRRTNQNYIDVVILLLGLAVVLLGLYVGGYLLSVRRGVWPQDGLLVPGVKSRYFAVGGTYNNRLAGLLFEPAAAIDRRWIRRRYWSGWHVVTSTNGTKTYYDIDFIEHTEGSNTYYTVPP